MARHRFLGLVCLVGLLSAGAENRHAAGPVVQCWPAPKEAAHWREDGFGPFAPSWPTLALVCKYAPDAPGAEKRAAMWDATLFLLSAPGLDADQALARMPVAARYATACRSVGVRGHWLRFGPRDERPCFVLAHPSGGTAGDLIRVFRHDVSYDFPHIGPTACQGHSFGEILGVYSRIPPLACDMDKDGELELLVGSEVTNLSGGPGTPQRYRIFKWDAGQRSLVSSREIEAGEAERLEKLPL